MLFRAKVASGITYVCSLSIAHNKANGICQWHWLYAAPLLHQLQSQDGVTQDCVSTDLDNIDWGISGLDKDKLQDFKCFVQDKRYSYLLYYEHEFDLAT